MAADYPDVELNHLYIDNAAMQLVRNPKQFDVILASNIFGDILSDEASQVAAQSECWRLPRSEKGGWGFTSRYTVRRPICGKEIANPLATILSAAMLLRIHNEEKAADAVEAAVAKCWWTGCAPTYTEGCKKSAPPKWGTRSPRRFRY